MNFQQKKLSKKTLDQPLGYVTIGLLLNSFIPYVQVIGIRKSPVITRSFSEPIPRPGEDSVSYERHIKILQVF